MQDLLLSYRILNDIYTNSAYASIELNKHIDDAKNREFVTKIVYGVLEKNVQFDYYIDILTTKKPKNSIIILLKMGMYMATYMDSIPDYAAVSKIVDLCSMIKKMELKGFVNAVMKKYILLHNQLPEDKVLALSVSSSTPLWLVKEYIKQYGYEKTKDFLSVDLFTLEHVRVNLRQTTLNKLKEKLKEKNIPYRDSIANAVFVQNSKYIREIFQVGLVTIQSKTSMLCCEKLNPKDGDLVLDMCAAPGGKSEYIAELSNCKVIACDIHEHRLKLIDDYAMRMGSKNIEVRLSDATEHDDFFDNKFDKVLCDVPCSGLGVCSKKPDIYLGLNYEDIKSLNEVQFKIISNAAKYVKLNGKMVYSTCTILKQENKNIVEKFLKANTNFRLVDEMQYLPDSNGQDGFYIALMEKVQ